MAVSQCVFEIDLYLERRYPFAIGAVVPKSWAVRPLKRRWPSNTLDTWQCNLAYVQSTNLNQLICWQTFQIEKNLAATRVRLAVSERVD